VDPWRLAASAAKEYYETARGDLRSRLG